jgi:NAD(P)-dependent dehydrogenase (short-subunit alcohol dehydrogenase family)
MTGAKGRRVVAVTGGGGGIGAAIAEELGRQGAFVVTMDPLVSLDGSESLPEPTETTADVIVAAGGGARATSVSVTDGDAIVALFEELGRLDAVVNVAGISRPTSFARGTEEDWRSVLSVHLDGYLNILRAALPIMAAAGHGRILGVTSGSGWRQADAGAYSCAKRAVAALTWQVGRVAPPGVVINAISPIAVTRMVTAALGAQPKAGGGSGSKATGGLSLGSMPEPEDLGPFGAHLVSDDFSWCSGRVFFAGGSEVAVIDEPRMLEVVRADDADSLAYVLESVMPGALAVAEAKQVSTGGSNPRFGGIFEDASGDLPLADVRSCAVVADDPAVAAALTAAVEARGVTCRLVRGADVAAGFPGAVAAMASVGSVDAVVVALAGTAASEAASWEQVLAEHSGIVDRLHADAGWARAVADHAAATEQPVRLVTLTHATTAGGRSRAQAAAQLARAARGGTADRVSAFAVSVEAPFGDAPIAELVAHLVSSPDSPSLSGAELVAGAGWVGLRSHPRPSGSITFGGPAVPSWLDASLRSIVR